MLTVVGITLFYGLSVKKWYNIVIDCCSGEADYGEVNKYYTSVFEKI